MIKKKCLIKAVGLPLACAFSVVIVAGLAVLTGCSGIQIEKDQQILLAADQPITGTKKTTDYSLEYQIVFQQKGSDGSGTIQFNGKLNPRRGLDSLTIWINFLDADGKIIGSKPIYAPGAGRGAAKSTLEDTFELPAGTVAVAFTHIGRERVTNILG